MITIAFANEKGGVGKSMSTLCVGYALLQRGYTVLWVDADQQGSLTSCFRYSPPPSLTLGPLLLNQVQPDDVVQQVVKDGWLIPAGPGLNAAATERARRPGSELALRKILALAEDFDFCLIDTPGSLGLLTTTALTAANYVFIPAQPQSFGIDGLADLILNCRLIQEGLNPRLKIGGLFFAMYNRNDRRTVQRNLVELLKAHTDLQGLLLDTDVRPNVRLEEAVTEKVNIYELDPLCNGAKDYNKLTGEILARLD